MEYYGYSLLAIHKLRLEYNSNNMEMSYMNRKDYMNPKDCLQQRNSKKCTASPSASMRSETNATLSNMLHESAL